MKARKSFGQDYECLQNWPDNIFLQCGEKGVVISRTKDVPSYQTAFFEAFPKEPSTFIRGEGKTLPEAEAAAFKKYERIMGCDGHEYKRKADSEHGTCVKCGLFTSNCFPPIHSCATCQKPHVNYSFEDKHYCSEHYEESVQHLAQNYSLDSTEELDTDDIFSEAELNKYHVEQVIFLNLAKKHHLLDLSKEDYEKKNYLYDKETHFTTFSHNKCVEMFNRIKAQEPEQKFAISIFSFGKITSNLFLDEELFEHLFLDFFQKNNQNYDEVFKKFFLQVYKPQ